MSATTPTFSFTQPTVGGDNGVWGGFLNTDLTNLDTYLGVLRQAAKVLTIGATTTLDFNAPASVFKLTVTQATTIAIANTPANITAQQLSTQFTLIIVNGGAFAVTWPGAFVWSGGAAPNLQVSGTDVIVGWSPDNGTTWYTSMLATVGKATLSKIGQLGALSTTSGSEVSLGTVVLSGGKLATNGDSLRIAVMGRWPDNFFGTGGATFKFKFGGATLSFPLPVVSGDGNAQNLPFTAVITVTRLSSATQQVTGQVVFTSGSSLQVVGGQSARVAGTETLANPVTLDFRGNVTSAGQTLSIDSAIVEAATQ
jgi:hypothetical protein